MTNRHPFDFRRASLEATAELGLLAAGRRLRLTRELTVSGEATSRRFAADKLLISSTCVIR